MPRLIWLLVIAGFVLPLGQVRACPDPVFKVLLENGAVHRYRVIVFHRGEMKGVDAQALGLLNPPDRAKRPAANMIIRMVDLTAGPDRVMQSIWEKLKAPSAPWLLVLPPRSYPLDQPLISLPLTADAVNRLLHSPLRKEIASRILRGTSAVWIVLEGTDAAANARAAKGLEEHLGTIQSSVVVKDNVDDFAKRLGIEYSMQEGQGTAPDIDVSFAVIRFTAKAAAEDLLARNLELLWPAAIARRPAGEPLVFPVFARGLVMPPLTAGEVAASELNARCETLVQPCTCTMDPADLGRFAFVTADWDLALREVKTVDEAVAPSQLTGFTADQAEAAIAAEPPAAAVPRSDHGLIMVIAIVGIAGGVGVGIAGFLLGRRSREN